MSDPLITQIARALAVELAPLLSAQPGDDPIFTVTQAAERLQVSRDTINGLIKTGQLRTAMVGGNCRRVRKGAIDAYLTAQERSEAERIALEQAHRAPLSVLGPSRRGRRTG